MGVQVPAVELSAQASQTPGHPVLQQTPSAQKLLVHSPMRPHAAPFAFFGKQAPPLQ